MTNFEKLSNIIAKAEAAITQFVDPATQREILEDIRGYVKAHVPVWLDGFANEEIDRLEAKITTKAA